jgi:hypothetical protein
MMPAGPLSENEKFMRQRPRIFRAARQFQEARTGCELFDLAQEFRAASGNEDMAWLYRRQCGREIPQLFFAVTELHEILCRKTDFLTENRFLAVPTEETMKALEQSLEENYISAYILSTEAWSIAHDFADPGDLMNALAYHDWLLEDNAEGGTWPSILLAENSAEYVQELLALNTALSAAYKETVLKDLKALKTGLSFYACLYGDGVEPRFSTSFDLPTRQEYCRKLTRICTLMNQRIDHKSFIDSQILELQNHLAGVKGLVPSARPQSYCVGKPTI